MRKSGHKKESLAGELAVDSSSVNVGNVSETLSVTQRTVERDFAILQKAGIIRHEGKVNAGIWVVLENSK